MSRLPLFLSLLSLVAPLTSSAQSEDFVIRGNAKNEKGDYNGAMADYNKAIEVNPYAFDAYCYRGDLRNKKGDYNGAMADFKKAIQILPTWPDTYYYRGWAETEKGDHESALADLNKAIELDPESPRAFDKRALIEELKEDYASALKDLVRSDEGASDPEEHDYAHLRIWVIGARQGKTAEANQELSAYLEKRVGSPDDWPSRIGDFLLGKTSESDFLAEVFSPNVTKNKSQSCQAWYFAAIKRQLAGDKKLAADYFTKCLATKAIQSDEYVRAKWESKALGVP